MELRHALKPGRFDQRHRLQSCLVCVCVCVFDMNMKAMRLLLQASGNKRRAQLKRETLSSRERVACVALRCMEGWGSPSGRAWVLSCFPALNATGKNVVGMG